MAFQVGQMVKLSSAPHDDPDDSKQVYMVMAIAHSHPVDQATVLQFNIDAETLPISIVPVNELMPVTYCASRHFGEEVIITKRNNSRVQGVVIKVHNDEVDLVLSPIFGGLQSNIKVSILDANGKKHTGMVFNPQPDEIFNNE